MMLMHCLTNHVGKTSKEQDLFGDRDNFAKLIVIINWFKIIQNSYCLNSVGHIFNWIRVCRISIIIKIVPNLLTILFSKKSANLLDRCSFESYTWRDFWVLFLFYFYRNLLKWWRPRRQHRQQLGGSRKPETFNQCSIRPRPQSGAERFNVLRFTQQKIFRVC